MKNLPSFVSRTQAFALDTLQGASACFFLSIALARDVQVPDGP